MTRSCWQSADRCRLADCMHAARYLAVGITLGRSRLIARTSPQHRPLWCNGSDVLTTDSAATSQSTVNRRSVYIGRKTFLRSWPMNRWPWPEREKYLSFGSDPFSGSWATASLSQDCPTLTFDSHDLEYVMGVVWTCIVVMTNCDEFC